MINRQDHIIQRCLTLIGSPHLLSNNFMESSENRVVLRLSNTPKATSFIIILQRIIKKRLFEGGLRILSVKIN